MTDQDSPALQANDSAAAPQDGDQARVNKLMSLMNKRTEERDNALGELQALRQQIAAVTVEDDEPERPARIDSNQPRKPTSYQTHPPTLDELEREFKTQVWPAEWGETGR